MNSIAPKTFAAGTAGTLSIALVEILSWILGCYHITLPSTVGASIATVLVILASYYAPHHTPTAEEVKTIQAEPAPPEPQSSAPWNTQ